ncbi:hypothetical protein ACOMHN_013663 [Nucella lapillus]
MQSFITALKILAKTCEYGTLKDSLIRDRIVCGVTTDALRKQLLKEKALDLHKAIQICQIHEAAEKHTVQVSEDHEVNTISQKKKFNAPPIKSCRFCGRSHPAKKEECPAYGKKCSSCSKMHHFAKVCRSTPRWRLASTVNAIGGDHSDEGEEPAEDWELHALTQKPRRNEIHCTAIINGGDLKLKIDTGAKCNVLPLYELKKVQARETINKAKAINLVAYGGERFSTLGSVDLLCKIGDHKETLTFQVIDRQATPILGLNDTLRLRLIQLDKTVYEVNEASEDTSIENILKEYPELFNDILGTLPPKYIMRIDPSITPIVKPARKVPQAMEKNVKFELENMVKRGVIVRETEPTEWVSQMVTARKKNGDIRICLDPRSLNTALQRPHFPMRTADEVASRIGNAKYFSTLDAKNGFWQIQMDEESSRRTTTCISTPFGRYRFLRMPFGINTASEVFQEAMERLFEGYPCAIIVDDILVWGSTDEEHDANLKKILERVRQIGLKLNLKKCKFRMKSVTFVGHKFTGDVLKPDTEKTDAIREMPAPKNKAALQRFLGMTNYLNKFIQNYSEKTAVLRELLRNDIIWSWTDAHQQALNRLKDDLMNPPVLKFFDPTKPVVLSVDASKNGLGAACLQEDAPVAYASRALSDCETRYAQIEKELLAAVFACRKFHDFVYGRKVTIQTDHKPLITIVKKSLNAAPARLQRMLLQLQRYNLNFVYKKGK